jgi:hypothetical protein
MGAALFLLKISLCFSDGGGSDGGVGTGSLYTIRTRKIMGVNNASKDEILNNNNDDDNDAIIRSLRWW